MCIYKVKKRKVSKTKCKLVKSVEYYVNGGLIEAELVYECKPKVKVKKRKLYTFRPYTLKDRVTDWLFG